MNHRCMDNLWSPKSELGAGSEFTLQVTSLVGLCFASEWMYFLMPQPFQSCRGFQKPRVSCWNKNHCSHLVPFWTKKFPGARYVSWSMLIKRHLWTLAWRALGRLAGWQSDVQPGQLRSLPRAATRSSHVGPDREFGSSSGESHQQMNIAWCWWWACMTFPAWPHISTSIGMARQSMSQRVQLGLVQFL